MADDWLSHIKQVQLACASVRQLHEQTGHLPTTYLLKLLANIREKIEALEAKLQHERRMAGKESPVDLV